MHRNADRALIRIAARRMHMRRLHKHQKRKQNDADISRDAKRLRMLRKGCGMAGIRSLHHFNFCEWACACGSRRKSLSLSIHILATFAESLLSSPEAIPQGFPFVKFLYERFRPRLRFHFSDIHCDQTCDSITYEEKYCATNFRSFRGYSGLPGAFRHAARNPAH